MRLLTVLALILTVTGCASTQPRGNVIAERQANSIDLERRSDDSAEQLLLLDRRSQNLSKQLDDMERKLQQGDNAESYDPSRDELNIRAYQEMSRSTQLNVAANKAELELKTAALENKLKTEITAIENAIGQEIAKLESLKALRITEAETRMRTRIANIRADAEISSANKAPPVLTSKGAYGESQGRPMTFDPGKPGKNTSLKMVNGPKADDLQRSEIEKRAENPNPVSRTPPIYARQEYVGEVQGIHNTQPQFPGNGYEEEEETIEDTFSQNRAVNGRVIVQEPPDTTPYYWDVYYLYENERSWKLFNQMLRSYGITDMVPKADRGKQRYITYVGRYSHQVDAERRKADLAAMLRSDHAKIKKSRIR